jgi:hypothetical protein
LLEFIVKGHIEDQQNHREPHRCKAKFSHSPPSSMQKWWKVF